jgi:hypothetical protein
MAHMAKQGAPSASKVLEEQVARPTRQAKHVDRLIDRR